MPIGTKSLRRDDVTNAQKKLETWLRDNSHTTSRDGIDFDRASEALGIGRRSLVRYLTGESEIPPYLSMLVDARTAYTAERAIIVQFKPMKSDPNRGMVTLITLDEESDDITGYKELLTNAKMTRVEALQRGSEEAMRRGVNKVLLKIEP